MSPLCNDIVNGYVAAALIVLLPSTGFAQTGATAARPPDFTVQVWGDAAADFSARIRSYAEYAAGWRQTFRRLEVTSDPADILRTEFTLARRLRQERKGVQLGHIFSPAISAAFRVVLLPELDAVTVATILDENPGRFRHRLDGTYPKERPLSTVPANVLRVLPALPADIHYRFLGHDLVLHDTRTRRSLTGCPARFRAADSTSPGGAIEWYDRADRNDST